MKQIMAIMVLVLVGFLGDGFAVIPQTINFQGVLTDGGGTVVSDGTYAVTFRLYDVPSGGSHLWEETHGTVTVTKGIFNVMLGSVVNFDLDFDTQYFLGISVEGEAELIPRVYLTSNAYCLGARGVYGDSNVIPSDGFVGIGTLLPNDPLTVQSDDAVGIRFNGYATAWAGIYVNAMQSTGKPQFGYMRGTLKANTYVDTNDYWRLYMNGSDRLTVTPDGYVGIGPTEPLEKLDVAGGIKIGVTSNTNAGTIRFSAGDFEGYDGSIWKSLTGTGGSSLPTGSTGQTLRHNGSDWIGVSNLYNDGSAIGIGTTSPTAPLDIAGGNWDLSATDGDLKIGDATYKLKIGVSTGGLGAGTAGIRMEGGEKKLILGAGTAEVLTILDDGTTEFGSDTQSGRMNLYGNGIAQPVIRAFPMTNGGIFYLYDEDYNVMACLTPDQSVNTGGYFYIRRNETETGFILDGNYSGGDEPSLGIYGSTRSAILNMYNSGNGSVSLPQDAISAYEVLDEPGGASYIEGSSSVDLATDYTMIAAQSIQAPTNGYILVIASCQGQVTHAGGTLSSAEFGISDTYDSFPVNQDVLLQLPSTAGTGVYCFPVTCTGFFAVAEGVHTFYFLGIESSGSYYALDVQFTAIFIPSAYGTVESTLATGTGSPDGDREMVITEADVVSQRAASEAANLARMERELSEIRAEVEAMKAESERQIREAAGD